MLTPLAVDASHPFPQLLNKSHNLLVRARAQRGGELLHAIVQVPRVLPRLILMPRGKGEDEPWDYIYLASLIKHHIADLFPGLILDGVHAFRVTRNSDLYIDEEEAENLLRSDRAGTAAFQPRQCRSPRSGSGLSERFSRIAPRVFRFAGGRSLQARRPAFDDASHAAGRRMMPSPN